MDLWLLRTRITAEGIKPEWVMINIRNPTEIPDIVSAAESYALIMELRNGDKFLEGIIAPSLINPEILA